MTSSGDLTQAPYIPVANRTIKMPEFELGDRLTKEQLAYFETNGFIRFKSFLPRERVREMIEEVEEIDRRLVAEGRTHINGVPLMFGNREDGTRFVQRMVFASLFGPRLHAFLADPRFAAILDKIGRASGRERVCNGV